MSTETGQFFQTLIHSHTGRGIIFGLALMAWYHVHKWLSLGFPALLIATALTVASIAFLIAGRCRVRDAWEWGRFGTAFCILLLLYSSMVLIGSWTFVLYTRPLLQEMLR